MRYLLSVISIIITLLSLFGCSKSDKTQAAPEEEYTIYGTIRQDSATAGSDLKLFIDKHSALYQDELPVLSGKFVYKSSTNDLDEVYIVDCKGRTVRVFATGGVQIEVNIDSLGTATFAGSDSLNQAFHTACHNIDSLDDTQALKKDKIKAYLDSLSKRYGNTALPALIVREKMLAINDSIYLRQYLGRLSDQSKPSWLEKSLEQQFDDRGLYLKRNVRLPYLPKFRTSVDSITFDMKETRQNACLLYFWADYDSTSIDSLQMLQPLAMQYGLHEYAETYKSPDGNRRPKRVDIFTFCLHAGDSASWLKRVSDLPGTHILLQDGFANPAIKAWNISRMPYNLIIDRYGNVQDSYRWGAELREVMDRQPNNYSIDISKAKQKTIKTGKK